MPGVPVFHYLSSPPTPPQYLLDPKISALVSRSMQRECVVVFDEAHNIDNICIEVMSINFRIPTIDAATANLARVQVSTGPG
jgi:DNA excision repair protein ERCC-2